MIGHRGPPHPVERLPHLGECHVSKPHLHTELAAQLRGKRMSLDQPSPFRHRFSPLLPLSELKENLVEPGGKAAACTSHQNLMVVYSNLCCVPLLSSSLPSLPCASDHRPETRGCTRSNSTGIAANSTRLEMTLSFSRRTAGSSQTALQGSMTRCSPCLASALSSMAKWWPARRTARQISARYIPATILKRYSACGPSTSWSSTARIYEHFHS